MIRQVRERVFVRTGHLWQLQSVVIMDDVSVTLFDPCYFPDEIEEIRAFVARVETPSRIKQIILTHSDFDHIAGVPYFPDFKVITAATWDSANETASIDKILNFDSEFYVNRPWQGKMSLTRADKMVQNEDQDGPFTYYHAKGHTHDGVVTVYQQVAVVGDHLSALEFPFIDTSYRDYCRTMKCLREIFTFHQVDCVITQHGPWAEGRDEIERRLQISEVYLETMGAVVTECITAGKTEDDTVRIATESVDFAGQPISIGIQSYHEKNARLMWKELSGDAGWRVRQ